MGKPTSFAHKEMSIFSSVTFKIGANFLFRLTDCLAVLYYLFKDQVFPTCTEVDLRFCISLMGQQGTLTPYHKSMQYLHIVIMAVSLMLLLRVFSRYQQSDLRFSDSKLNRKLQRSSKENHQFQSKSG